MNQQITGICKPVALNLCGLHSESQAPSVFNGPSLVFPLSRPSDEATNPKPRVSRVSETEARILFCLSLDKSRIPFAVEVPTLKKYQFTGKKRMSARSDVVVYSHNSNSSSQLKRQLAVEFKFGNPQSRTITKDLEKLVKEGYEGLWFHLFLNIDSGTIRVLFKKFRDAFEDQALLKLWRDCKHPINFVLVVINKPQWLHRTISPVQDPAEVFKFIYSTSGGGIVTVEDANGWDHEPL